jgi:tetratricopeptide (TPR) repeat protein
MTSGQHTAAALCARLADDRRRLGADQALARLAQQLESQPVSVWIECARDVAAAPDEPAALRWLHEATLRWPNEIELRYCLAMALWNHGEAAAAEHALRHLLTAAPAHAAGTELLARILRNDGQLGAAAQLAYEQARRKRAGMDEVLRAVNFIRHCQRHALAARLCDDALGEGPRDASLCAQAGLLALELGRFDAARAYLIEAIERGVDHNTWFVFGALALAQKYTHADHPDLQLFMRHLHAPGLSALAQASLTFALAKAHDDVGDTAQASALWRTANAQVRALKPWPAARYNGQIDALLRAPSGPALPAAPIVPIFVVGLPRSGTTLAAVSLGRLPGVRDRGELPHIDFIAQRLAGAQRHDADALHEAAQLYYRHLRQDDAPARYYIDKTPTNFLRLDLIANLFPQAHVVHCRRNRRDTALSLYAQHFAHADGDFSYAFADIATFAAGHDRLMEHWHRTLSLPIHTLDYEHMVGDPQAAMTQLRKAIAIATGGDLPAPDSVDGVIGSSSLWQAKQPVYTSSLGRWRSYAEHLPELEALFPDRTL